MPAQGRPHNYEWNSKMLRERIKSVRQTLKNSQRVMANTLGISLKSWQDYEAGKSVPGGKVFQNICRLGFSGTWLLLGEGPMFHQQLAPLRFQEPVSPYDPNTGESDDATSFYPIPMVESFLDKGDFVYAKNKGPYAFRKNWLGRLASSPERVVMAGIPSMSMEPTILNQEVVMLDTERKRVFEGSIYAVAYADSIVLRRLKLLPDGRIHVTWDNITDDRPYDVDPGDLDILGQVVWFSRELVRT